MRYISRVLYGLVKARKGASVDMIAYIIEAIVVNHQSENVHNVVIVIDLTEGRMKHRGAEYLPRNKGRDDQLSFMIPI